MSKTTKTWLIIATFLIVLGIGMFVIVMSKNNWDFTKLSTVKHETNTYQISEKFQDISINTDTADIIFIEADDGECKVVCHEEQKVKHSVTIEDGTLKIHAIDTRRWYEHIGINIGTPRITVYLEENEYNSISIKESTGDIELGDISANILDISVSTGDIKLSNINCKNLISKGSTGDIILSNVIAKEKISIDTSTGDINFKKCDANELSVNTDTGDIIGSLLTDKVFIAQTDTGRINVPKTTVGGRCEITTDTGDIEIQVQ